MLGMGPVAGTAPVAQRTNPQPVQQSSHDRSGCLLGCTTGRGTGASGIYAGQRSQEENWR